MYSVLLVLGQSSYCLVTMFPDHVRNYISLALLDTNSAKLRQFRLYISGEYVYIY